MEAQVTDEIIASQTPEAQAIIRALLAKIATMEAELDALRRQMKGKTPQNSSLPPSTQHPHAKPRREGRKSKRRRGGQPGHAKYARPLIPTKDCDVVQSLKPKQCVAAATNSRVATHSRCDTRYGNCRRSSWW